MIDYKNYLLGKSVQVTTKANKVHVGEFEGIQILGPTESSSFVVLKLNEDLTMFIPENLIERMYLASESSLSGEDGERS